PGHQADQRAGRRAGAVGPHARGRHPVHLRGTSADVAANDDYHDKDAYLVTLGAGVNEVDVRLTWPDGDIDMDAMAFVAEMVDNDIAGGAGAFIGTMADE